MAKVAVTAWPCVIVTVHEAVPVQAPAQPVKVELSAGVAVSVTSVESANEAVHVDPHTTPNGLLGTVPKPEPVLVTVSA